jgi:hypothetical protein
MSGANLYGSNTSFTISAADEFSVDIDSDNNDGSSAFRITSNGGTSTHAAFFDTGNLSVGGNTDINSFSLSGIYTTNNGQNLDTAMVIENNFSGDRDSTLRFSLDDTRLFTLGVDDSDSDKFKIYSGDGLASGDEFVIDANGTTTIANLNLGATTFDENAGAVTWIDMSVTSAAAVDTIESYTAAIDGNSMLTVYAESDGAGSIQNKAINFFDGAAGSVSAKYLSNNFGTAMYGGAFIDANSYYGQEFGSDTTGSITADSATVVGDDGKWYFDTTDTAATYVQQDQINGYGTVGVTTTATDIAGGIFFGEAQNNLSLVFAKANLPVVQMKLRNTDGGTTGNDVVWGLMDQATSTATNDTLPANGMFFWSNNTTTWTGVVRSGGTNVGTVTCGTQSTTQFAVGRIEVISATSVKFWMDTNVSDGVNMQLCGTVSGANPTAALGLGAYVVHTGTTATNVDVDYMRVWQDDSLPGSVVTYPKSAKSSLEPTPPSPLDLLTEKVDEQKDLIEQFTLQTTENVTTLSELQSSIDEELLLASTNLTALATKDTEIDAKLAEHDTYFARDLARLDTLDTLTAQIALDQNTLAANLTSIQSDMVTLTAQVGTLTEFFNAFDLGNMIAKDELGNVDLLSGALRAKSLATGGITIEVADEEAPTIGTATVLPVKTDVDGDGKDDETGSDGRSVEVRTKAMIPMVNGSRIFTSFKGNPNAFSWIEKVRDAAGDYVGFKIRLSDPVTDVVKVDWWLIEQKDTFSATP